MRGLRARKWRRPQTIFLKKSFEKMIWCRSYHCRKEPFCIFSDILVGYQELQMLLNRHTIDIIHVKICSWRRPMQSTLNQAQFNNIYKNTSSLPCPSPSRAVTLPAIIRFEQRKSDLLFKFVFPGSGRCEGW